MTLNYTTIGARSSSLRLKMIRPNIARVFVPSVLALFMWALTPATVQGQGNINPRIHPPLSKPYGQSYSQWAATYWQWLLSFPADESPATEQGEVHYGAANQSGPVWILESGNSGVLERNLHLPPGKSLLFSITGAEADTLGFPGFSEQDLRDQVAAPFNDFTILTLAEVDGIPIQNVDLYMVTSPLFDINLPDPNLFGEPSGAGKAMAKGWFFILAPLSKGQHTLRVAYHVVEFPEADGDTTYHLTAE